MLKVWCKAGDLGEVKGLRLFTKILIMKEMCNSIFQYYYVPVRTTGGKHQAGI